MLTPAELAAHYRCSERTIARMTAEGMPSKLVRGRRRYDLAETDAYTREKACLPGETKKAAGTRKPALSADAFTAAARKVHLRAMPSA